MEGNAILFWILCAIISLVITYHIIKAAVRSANKELSDKLEILARLKFLELKMEGHDAEVSKTLRIADLDRQVEAGYIAKELYEKEKQKVLANQN